MSGIACMGGHEEREQAGSRTATSGWAALALSIALLCSSATIPARALAGDPAGKGSTRNEPEATAVEVQADLLKVAEKYAEFLKDPWLRYGATHFGNAIQAAKSLTAEGQVNYQSVNEFHDELDEFLRGLDMLTSWQPGNTGWGDVKGTTKPQPKLIKEVHGHVLAAKTKANRVPALQELSLITFSAATTAEMAVQYGSRMTARLDQLLYNRELEHITGYVKAKTTETVGKSFQELSKALGQIGEGENEADEDAKRKHFTESVAAVQQCIAAFRKDMSVLSLELTWARPRLALVEVELQHLEKNLAQLKPKKG